MFCDLVDTWNRSLDVSANWVAAHPVLSAICKEHTRNPRVWDDPANRAAVAIAQRDVAAPRLPTSGVLWSGSERDASYWTDPPLGVAHPLHDLPYLTSSYSLSIAQKYAVEHGLLLELHFTNPYPGLCLDRVSVHGDAEHEILIILDPEQWELIPRARRDNILVCDLTFRDLCCNT